ncbi:Hypothetical predicted protein [Octopus vulgaris]|uniref:Uncharacterized protein n=1 Tax=Octopus vulgaris TaxID=6645 RepID=A0AA36EYS5_OCTVU|nr:Hypothetical predicted protein [Octopus vulgaris]
MELSLTHHYSYACYGLELVYYCYKVVNAYVEDVRETKEMRVVAFALTNSLLIRNSFSPFSKLFRRLPLVLRRFLSSFDKTNSSSSTGIYETE